MCESEWQFWLAPLDPLHMGFSHLAEVVGQELGDILAPHHRVGQGEARMGLDFLDLPRHAPH